METKPLLYGLIGFFVGGLLVAIAATTFDKPSEDRGMTMDEMSETLQDKRGDEFDKAFIAEMIEHHEGAIEMAELSDKNAKHDKIKQLSQDIISAQEAEIAEMKKWQQEWGYADSDGMAR